MDIRPLFVRLGFVALCTVLCFDDAAAGVNRWTSHGPDGGGGLIVVDPRDANHLYVATQGLAGPPVSESRDGGAHWTAASDGISTKAPYAYTVRQLVLDPARPNVLYATTIDGALFRSVDGGASWQRRTSPPSPVDITVFEALALDPADGDTLYANATLGLWRSDDGGGSWIALSQGLPADPRFSSITADPTSHGTVFAGGASLYKSTNFGATWRPSGDGLEGRAVRSIAIDPRTSAVVHVATDSGVYRSTDGGASWNPSGLAGLELVVIAVDPVNSLVVYVGAIDGFYRSRDGGRTWERRSTGGGASYVTSVAAGADARTVYAYPGSGLVRSADRGDTWADVSAGLPNPFVFALAAGPGADGRDVYAGGSRVVRTLDGGRTWNDPGNAGLTSLVLALVRDPVAGETLYAGGIGVFRTTDGGATWVTRGLEGQNVYRLALDTRRPQVLLASAFQSSPSNTGGVWRSLDGGATWHEVTKGLPPQAFVRAFAFDPSRDGVVYGAVSSNGGGVPFEAYGVYRSTDGGTSWNQLLQGAVEDVVLASEDPQTLYAGGVYLWRSRDGGATWATLGNSLGGRPVNDLAVDPSHFGVLYAAASGGVFRSSNGGESFQPMTSGLDSLVVNALLVTPSGKGLYAAGTGVFSYSVFGPAVTLPAAASLHGIPPAYFHSDVSVFNGSRDAEANVVATYRCLVGSCPPIERTFKVAPRQVRAFEDIVSGLFEQAESGGAVEFESDQPIVVTSRLFTPDRPAPTLGMFVPGLRGDQAYPRALLSSLAHSADPAAGSRTNVGVYNGNDESQTVRFSFVGPDGAAIGEVSRLVPAREALQINDGDLPLAGAGDLPSFQCFVEGDGEAPLFAYAVVIDNQSQDAIFVPGRDAAATFGGSLTLPAVASLHGAGGSFFHSDVAVTNPTNASVSVNALYRCALGVCQNVEEKSFSIAPGEIAQFDDIVADLFESPETAGVLELKTLSFGRVVATSRLFTPSRPAPTVGMFVPALDQYEATPAAVLTSLSRSADRTRGSRVNVGVYNGDFASGQNVTFRLFRGDGVLLGQVSRLLGSQSSVQINDLFGAIGVDGDVPSAYCLVEGDTGAPLYAYAAVIDNQSQDPIFVTGQNDPNPPPLQGPASGANAVEPRE